MNIFQTAMISQVLFGAGARHSIGQTLTNMGAKKALIVTDKFLHDSGLSNNVEASIKNAGIESVMFDGTEPENPIEVIDVVKILIIEEKIDAIIGLGGGSAMDLAKCARTMTVNERPIQNYYDLRVPRKTNPIPMILIPTTAGTSSEVSHDAVAFDKSIQKKIGFSGSDLAGTIACVDPELTIGLTFTENADLDEIKTTTANTIRTLCKDLGLRSLSELIIQQFLQKSLKIIIP